MWWQQGSTTFTHADSLHSRCNALDELLEDGTFYGEMPPCKGVWSNVDSLEICREELQDSLEEWIILGLRLGHRLPVVEDFDVYLSTAEVA